MSMRSVFRPKRDFDYDSVRTCMSCNNEFSGRFCPQCGERVIAPNERHFKDFLIEVFSAFTFADSKLLRSLKTIILTPGQYSLDFAEGRRLGYMRPVSLFLLANLIYFLFPIFQTFNTSLRTQEQGSPYSKVFRIKDRVAVKSELMEMTHKEFETIYNRKSEANAKTILILMVLIYSLLISVLFINRKQLFFDHLLFSIEFFIYTLFVGTIGLSFLFHSMNPFIDLSFLTEDLLGLIVLILSGYFMIGGLRRLYRMKWLTVSIYLVPTILLAMISVVIYRWLLFEITFGLL